MEREEFVRGQKCALDGDIKTYDSKTPWRSVIPLYRNEASLSRSSKSKETSYENVKPDKLYRAIYYPFHVCNGTQRHLWIKKFFEK